jgi:hypothetical protein
MTNNQSVSLSWCQAPSGSEDLILLLSDICRFVDMGCPLWWEDGSVIYSCCWPSPVQSFLGTSLARIMTIFYCLRLKIFLTCPCTYIPKEQGGPFIPPKELGSLFVASSDAQGYSGESQTSLHTGGHRLLLRVTLQMAVYRHSVHHGTKSLEAHDQSFCIILFSCSLAVIVIMLSVCLTRGWICHLRILFFLFFGDCILLHPLLWIVLGVPSIATILYFIFSFSYHYMFQPLHLRHPVDAKTCNDVKRRIRKNKL